MKQTGEFGKKSNCPLRALKRRFRDYPNREYTIYKKHMRKREKVERDLPIASQG